MMTELSDSDRIARLEAELAAVKEQLRELDHRIKNDLQLVASVFLLQLRRAAPGPERDAVRAALERINCVLAVHRRLDPAHDAGRMDVAPLVGDVAEEIVGAARREDVHVSLDVAPLVLPCRQAAPLALIAGELVRNALRHAFPDRGGQITVRLGGHDGTVELSVADNGVGRRTDQAGGFGSTLVALLSQQLRGEFKHEDAAPGLRALVRFPEST
jgi:two-component sensor histidine kinase